jgi:C4-dicarboxylate transporter DctM subunit
VIAPAHRAIERQYGKARKATSMSMSAVLAYFVLPATLLVLGLPIFLVLLVTCLVIVLLIADVPTDAVQTFLFSGLDNFPLLAVPFFVLAGEIMAQGGIARRVVVCVMALIGGVRGSLGVTTVVASELFGAMAHTAVGTVVAVGRMIYPSLKDNGYNERFAVGLIASSGAIAVVIPPSIAMILYSVSAQQSAVALFTAGILPSLLIGFVDACYVMVYARIKAVPLTSKANWKAIWTSTKEASWSIGTVVVIFGGIYGGVFTPTEAAGVAVIYSLFVTMVVHREVDLRDLWRIIQSAVFLISQILMIVTAAGLYSWLLTISGIPQQMIAEIHALQMPTWALLLSINVVLLIMGSFLEPPAAILIMTPLLLPVVQSVGVDAVHFGIIMAVNLSIGMYTPPFGLNLFASQAVFQTSLGIIYRGVLPFLLINFATLMVITYVPAISMVLLGR